MIRDPDRVAWTPSGLQVTLDEYLCDYRVAVDGQIVFASSVYSAASQVFDIEAAGLADLPIEGGKDG